MTACFNRWQGIFILMGFILLGSSIDVFAQESRSLREMMITPGKLHSAHQKLEKNCNACHVEFTRGEQDNLCLDCHQVITADIQFKQGFHGRLDKPACLDCHSEHLGKTGTITVFDPELFDHDQTDFQLIGEHRQLVCDNCHNDEKRSQNKLPGEFRIEAQTCVDCHANPHHTAENNFTTIHEGVRAEVNSDKTYGGINNKTNSAKSGSDGDIKANSTFSNTCTDCHSEKGWNTTTFNHSDTGFALEHRHAELHCAACHTDSTYSAPTECKDCHQLQDPHWGTVGEKCADCHQTAGWDQLTFDHKDTHFPLKGKHQDLTCQLCHVQSAKILAKQFINDKQTKTICYSCHASDDLHEGGYGTNCQMCHTEKKWDTASFNHDKNTDFKLTGPHSKTECLACHAPAETEPPGNRCIDCHAATDIHQGKLGTSCDDCHTGLDKWQQPLFDHDFTNFPLIGLHRILGCQSCHVTDKTFQLSLTKCDQCHLTATSHEYAFKTTCEACHSTRGWEQPQFDHQNKTQFPLRGAHTEVACFTCHNKDIDTPDTPDRRCYACHKKDDIHDQHFGPQCDNCHNENDFAEVLTNRR